MKPNIIEVTFSKTWRHEKCVINSNSNPDPVLLTLFASLYAFSTNSRGLSSSGGFAYKKENTIKVQNMVQEGKSVISHQLFLYYSAQSGQWIVSSFIKFLINRMFLHYSPCRTTDLPWHVTSPTVHRMALWKGLTIADLFVKMEGMQFKFSHASRITWHVCFKKRSACYRADY